ncbi:LPS assembly lipoprotein LptE [Noviherbaspirillum agri]
MKRRTLLTLAAAAMLSACGFQLRGSNGGTALPFKTIYVGFAETSPLGTELKRHIRASGDTQVVTDPKAAQVILDVLSESREKAILSKNTQGRVREYTLYYRLGFRVRDNKSRELLAPTEIVLKRDISFNESAVMAKESEEALLYRDMQSDLVQQMLRRLQVLKPV